jgi:hypothetical protein
MKANTLLRTAATILQKRGKDYGTMRENHQRIADIWTVIMQKEVTPEQVALCMAGVKIARLVQSPEHEDSWLDLAGYAAVGAEILDDGQAIDD